MIRRNLTLLALLALVCGASAPAGAEADNISFVPGSTTLTALNRDGTRDIQAGTHPWSYNVHFDLATEGEETIGGAARNIVAELPRGLVANPQAVPVCSRGAFEGGEPQCPASSQVGVLHGTVAGLGEVNGPIYNLEPPPGVAAELGFSTVGFNAIQDGSVKEGGSYRLMVNTDNVPLEITSATERIWGVPADPEHFGERICRIAGGLVQEGCASDAPVEPFLSLPGLCQEPLSLRLSVNSILAPDFYAEQSGFPLDSGGQPTAFRGCQSVPFTPKIAASPTSRLAENPSGLEFELKLPNNGLLSPTGINESEPEKVEVTLPEGVTANPSFAEGIGTCSEAAYLKETFQTPPGEGCPEASKIGSVISHTPLLDEPLEGSLYLATPYENEFHSLVAIYMVLRAPERGVFVKQAGEVQPDPATGRLFTTFKALPPLPYTTFHLHFREGARAPLVTPAACGEYKTVARLYPFSQPETANEQTASFQIEHGAEGGSCPAEGTPPFHPGLIAGTLNNAAGSYSPFDLRLSRTDSEQEITHFSIKLPPGITGKLAGIPFCSDKQIAAAKSREGTHHGGQEEIEHPSCPAASEIGHTLVGVGVGSSLAYVPGKVYLAGPYHGSNLSIVAVTSGVVGPFDVGTVVIREAIKVNPETAEVSVDAAGSDPLPHILKGIPVHLRDIRVYVDRPEFVLNPTSCTPTSTASTVLGSGTNFASEADDRPVTVTSRFQAADCASLAFRPRVKLSLKGKTRRGGLPRLKAVVTPRPGEANIRKAVVTLPRSEFLEQGHIGTVCTRVQFNEGGGNGERCPAKSVYGHAVAITPLLSEPLEGPVFMRSNGGERQLPDLVAALHTKDIDIDLVGFINSLHRKGSDVSQIRNTFATAPDAPVTRFTLEMFGGKKGLLVNSTNICKGRHRAIGEFTGQNGKRYDIKPVVKAQCKKKGRKHKKAKGHHKDAKGKGKGSARLAQAILHRVGW